MTRTHFCSQGHQWEADNDSALTCPRCGETSVLGQSVVGHSNVAPTSPTPSPSQASPDWPHLPGYRIERELGRGGMGVVYLARDLRLNRLVAVKMMSAAYAGGDLPQRLRTEAEAVARLQHPHIVQIFEIGEHQGRPFLALEYVEGRSLAEVLSGTPVPAEASARLVGVLARAVQHAHERGIVHRDLKPANVLLSVASPKSKVESPNSGGAGGAHQSKPLSTFDFRLLTSAKVADFGLAKRVDLEDSSLTRTGLVMGTPSYMAPEQAEGHSDKIGPSVDIYALGAILYELLTGRPPFKGATAVDTVLQVRFNEPVPPSRLQPGTPRDLETICLKCLSKKAARRYSSAAALADDLERFLDGQPIHARPVGWIERTLKWTRRRPATAALIGVSVLGAAALLVTSLLYNARLADEAEEVRKERNAAVAAELKATAQQERAQKHLKKSLVAVDKFLIRVGTARIGLGPQMEDERKKIFEEALAFCQEFLAEIKGDPLAQEEVGQTLLRQANLYRFLAQHKRAEEAFQEAIAFLADNAKRHPDNGAFARHLAFTHFHFGNLYLLSLSDFEPARTEFDKARAVMRVLLEKSPQNEEYRDLLATVEHHLGYVHFITGDEAGSERHYLAALDIRRKLAVEFADKPEHAQNLAATLNLFGRLLQGTGRLKEAEPRMEESVKILEGLKEKHPQTLEYASELGAGLVNLGMLYSQAEERDKSIKAERRAIELFTVLAKARPQVPEYQRMLALASQNLAETLIFTLKEKAEGEKHLDFALEKMTDVARMYPNAKEYQANLALVLQNLGRLYSITNRPEQAMGAFTKAETILTPLAKVKNPDLDWVTALGRSRYFLGLIALQKKDFTGGIEWLSKGIEALDAIKTKARLAEFREVLVKCLERRGFALTSIDKNRESLADWDRLKDLTEGKERVAYQIIRVRVLVRLGEAATAAAELDLLPDLKQIPTTAYYNLAAALSLLAETHAAANTDEGMRKAKEFADRAVLTLELAAKAGRLASPGMLKQLQTDRDFRHLRPRADFQALLAKR